MTAANNTTADATRTERDRIAAALVRGGNARSGRNAAGRSRARPRPRARQPLRMGERGIGAGNRDRRCGGRAVARRCADAVRQDRRAAGAPHEPVRRSQRPHRRIFDEPFAAHAGLVGGRGSARHYAAGWPSRRLRVADQEPGRLSDSLGTGHRSGRRQLRPHPLSAAGDGRATSRAFWKPTN